jgi:hypothetical protein
MISIYELPGWTVAGNRLSGLIFLVVSGVLFDE